MDMMKSIFCNNVQNIMISPESWNFEGISKTYFCAGNTIDIKRTQRNYNKYHLVSIIWYKNEVPTIFLFWSIKESVIGLNSWGIFAKDEQLPQLPNNSKTLSLKELLIINVIVTHKYIPLAFANRLWKTESQTRTRQRLVELALHFLFLFVLNWNSIPYLDA